MLLFSRCHKNPESERKYWSKYELKLEGKKGQRGGGKDGRASKMRRQRKGKVTGYKEKGLCL
jgi:hypothetical protein